MTLKQFCIFLGYALSFLVLPALAVAHSEVKSVKSPIRIGLTPVFLDHQPVFNNEWRLYLERHLGQPVVFVQRKDYRAIVDMLHEKKLDFAWLSGFPYVRHKNDLRLVAVPLYKGEPLYQSYIIVAATNTQISSLEDLRGKSFAFSDPDSNSGYLYLTHFLAQQGEKPSSYFGRHFFAWSHLKVIEAVASGLAEGGSVDGYVWDTLALAHPELTSRTRILQKSPQFGNAPFVASAGVANIQAAKVQRVLIQMVRDSEGRRLLKMLNLDKFTYGNDHIYDAIEKMSHFVEYNQ